MARNYAALPHEYLEEMDILSDAEFGRLCRALLQYSMDGKEGQLEGAEKVLWKRVKRQEDLFQKTSDGIAPGEDHWNWKGGITPKNQKERGSAKAHEWRDAIFARDGYTCRICGSRGGKLNAHHKKKWSEYPSLRYDLSNGITLCEDCHKKIHKKPGVS